MKFVHFPSTHFVPRPEWETLLMIWGRKTWVTFISKICFKPTFRQTTVVVIQAVYLFIFQLRILSTDRGGILLWKRSQIFPSAHLWLQVMWSRNPTSDKEKFSTRGKWNGLWRRAWIHLGEFIQESVFMLIERRFWTRNHAKTPKSDIGGAAGLALGMSLATFFGALEYLIYRSIASSDSAMIFPFRTFNMTVRFCRNNWKRISRLLFNPKVIVTETQM